MTYYKKTIPKHSFLSSQYNSESLTMPDTVESSAAWSALKKSRIIFDDYSRSTVPDNLLHSHNRMNPQYYDKSHSCKDMDYPCKGYLNDCTLMTHQ